MNEKTILNIFKKNQLKFGRKLNKKTNVNNICDIFLHNTFIFSLKRKNIIWFGDIDLYRDDTKINKIAKELDDLLYLVLEKDIYNDLTSDKVKKIAIWNSKIN